MGHTYESRKVNRVIDALKYFFTTFEAIISHKLVKKTKDNSICQFAWTTKLITEKATFLCKCETWGSYSSKILVTK